MVSVIDKSDITVSARAPADCSVEEIVAFQHLVLLGGEVAQETLSGLVKNALSLAFAKTGNTVLAVAALKRPNASYRARVFKKAGSTHNHEEYEFELGWVFVHQSARGRGLATQVVEALVPTLGSAKAYATSRVDNNNMHSSLRRVGFTPVGTSYPSKLKESHIQLFVCR